MMQCGGCGSKIPQTVLEKIFEKNFQEGSFDANEITGEKVSSYYRYYLLNSR